MALSYKEVAEILKLVDASDCQEVVVEVEGTRLVVRKGEGELTTAAPAPAAGKATRQSDDKAAEKAPAKPASAKPATGDGDGGTYLRAPMVGTFYRRPSPEDPPLAEEGAKVKAGDPMCLIEVMKLYTTIEAPCDGTVKSVLVEDATLVEFDQPLFVIEPDA
jgi:acetyl-CoA carboxylase biotin carboxyl carrier protein